MATDLSITEAFEKWALDLIRYANAIVGPDDAEDVVSWAFLRVMDSGRWPTVRDPRNYLFKAVLHAALAQRRSDRGRVAREWRAERQRVVPTGELLGDPTVRAAVAELSLRQRAVIHLTYWEDMTPAAIAVALGVSEGSVKQHLARARRRMRRVLSDG